MLFSTVNTAKKINIPKPVYKNGIIKENRKTIEQQKKTEVFGLSMILKNKTDNGAKARRPIEKNIAIKRFAYKEPVSSPMSDMSLTKP